MSFLISTDRIFCHLVLWWRCWWRRRQTRTSAENLPIVQLGFYLGIWKAIAHDSLIHTHQTIQCLPKRWTRTHLRRNHSHLAVFLLQYKKAITQNSFFTDLQYNTVFKHDKVIKTFHQRFPVLRFNMSITDMNKKLRLKASSPCFIQHIWC